MVDYFAALGAKRPDVAGGAGEKVQADNPAPAKAGGETVQEVADPATKNENNTELDLTAESCAANDGPGEKAQADNPAPAGESNQDNPEMTKAERAKNAQRRREVELEQIRTQERQAMEAKYQRQLDEGIAKLQISDPYTGKLVNSMAEYEAYVKARDEQEIADGLSQAGIERQTIDRLIDNHPAVLEAKKLSAEATLEKNHAQEASAQERAKEQLEIIQSLDPSIKTMEDLHLMKNFDAIYTRVRDNGLSISEAFRLENTADIEKRRTEAAVQQAINAQRGKEHMTGEGAGAGAGKGGIVVPQPVANNYRKFFPGITTADIQKKYEAYTASVKKG